MPQGLLSKLRTAFPFSVRPQTAHLMPPEETSPNALSSTTSVEAGSWLPPLRPVTWRDPPRWLAAGWRDFVAAPSAGLFYGACFVAMGWAMAWVFIRQPAYLLALAGGFMLMSPFLCVGLYEVSRQREQGQPIRLWHSLTAWRRNLSALAIYCVVLLVLEMLWSRSALVIFAVAFNTVPDAPNWLAMLADPSNWGFVITYLVVGAVFASLIFATTVVSMPMLLDHDEEAKADAIVAGLTSIRVCLTFPLTMALWGALIATLVLVAMLPAFLGLLVVAPVIGHASWHAYRAVVMPWAPPSAPRLSPPVTENALL